MRKFVSFAVFLVHVGASGCGSDTLRAVPRQAIQRDEPRVVPTEEPEPVETGAIEGRVCNEDLGLWMGGINAVVQTADGPITDMTDGSGRYLLENLPVGDYVVHLGGPGYAEELAAMVVANQTTVLGPTTCIGPLGTIRGRVCNEALGEWAAGAKVTLNDRDSSTTFTDANGYFELLDVPAGSYMLTYSAPGFSDTDSASVAGDQITEVGATYCEPLPPELGGVRGRICAGNTYWVSGALVVITSPTGTSEQTLTDGDGYFSFDDLVPGTHSVDVSRGSFEMSFDVEIPEGAINVLEEDYCFPPTTKIAVVTGLYDGVEVVLDRLGFPVQASYGASSPVPVDAGGNVDLIHGRPDAGDANGDGFDNAWDDWPSDNPSKYWIRTFLADPTWMAEYDIIFFACGFNETDLSAHNAYVGPALDNLRGFVADGGSVYASDWASELVRLAFPGQINFHGTDFGDSRLGKPNPGLPTFAVDTGLVQSLGRTSLSLNFNLDFWVVMEASQPGSLQVLVDGDVVRFTGFDPNGPTVTVHDAPVVAHFDYGEGRVLFTSAHTESQTTSDLEDVLNYMIFEL